MSNPHTFNALKQIGLIPQETVLIGPGNNPLKIELSGVETDSKKETLVLTEPILEKEPNE
jgi:hypothetical protein